MVRTPKRPSGQQRLILMKKAADAVYLRYLYILLVGQGWHDGWNSSRHHSLSCPGRTDIEDVMHAGHRDLRGPLEKKLTIYLREIHIVSIFLRKARFFLSYGR